MPKDFFISYNSADENWAEWIAWQLEEAGYEVIIQAWDAKAGQDSVEWMNKALEDYQQIIGVFSNAYLADEARFSKMERNTAIYDEKLIPVRIETVELKGLLSRITRIDLFDLSEEKAKQKLLQEVEGHRKKPRKSPVYPGQKKHTVIKPERFPGGIPSVWNLPHFRNPNFTGRKNLFDALRKTFTLEQPPLSIAAIHGLGGVGKTQLALEYAYHYASEYEIIWWIRAEDTTTLTSDFAGLASELNLPEKDAKDQGVIIAAVRRWLDQNYGWLTVFDNAKNVNKLQPYLPHGNTGDVLITTRNPNWGDVARPFKLKEFSLQEAVDFLCNRTGQSDQTTAKALAEMLGYLPLALTQAAAYISETGIGFNDYLKLFISQRREIWDEENSPYDYPETVDTTWSLALGKIKEEEPAGANILNLCTFFAPDEIPRSLLNQEIKNLPHGLSETLMNTLTINKGIKALNRYSLIDAKPKTFSIHRLVQAVVYDHQAEDERKKWIEAGLHILNNAFPSDGYSNPSSWQQCQILLPHAQSLVNHMDTLSITMLEAGDLMNKIGLYLNGRFVLDEAETLFRRTLELRQSQLPEKHLKIGQIANNLATLLMDQKKYSEGETLYQQALNIYESQSEQEQSAIGTLLGNLAGSLRRQKKYVEAEALFRKAIDKLSAHFGEEHPKVANILSNLALTLYEQRKYAEAEAILQKALKILTSSLDQESWRLASIYTTLGRIYTDQARYTDAERSLERSLDIKVKHFGERDPRVAAVLAHLAYLRIKQGRKFKAEELLRQSLEIYESEISKDHPWVAGTSENLGDLLRSQEKYTEAESFYRRALEVRKRYFGEDHSSVARILNIIASLLQEQGQYAEAEPLYRRALSIYEAVLGKDHPNTNTVRDNLNILLDEIKTSDDQQ